MRGLSLPLTSVMQHNLARLPPDVLPHDHESHVGRQDRIVARDLPQIIRLQVELRFVGFLFVFVPRGCCCMETLRVCLGRRRRRRRLVVRVKGRAGRCVGCDPARSTEPHALYSFLDLRHSQVGMLRGGQSSKQ